MNVIQQIGAYAGFAAIVGLAVLSVLYFSQARDVRRLREWAGRAPDRPGPARPHGAEPRAPSPREAPARASAEQPPAEKAAASAAGAGAAASANATQPHGAPAVTALRPSAPTAAQVTGRGAARPVSGGAGPAAVGARTATGPAGGRSGPARVEPPVRGGPNGRPAQRSAVPYLVLAAVGVLIVLGAAAFALGLVGGRSETAPGGGSATAQRQAAGGGATLAPHQVTFSVLNGTSVDGLGKQVADELEAAGYRRGNVTNAGEQRSTSVVMYAQGARRAAAAVGRRLHVRDVEPVDSRSQALAGDATVVVVVGADRAQ